jgi:hypothetical protein
MPAKAGAAEGSEPVGTAVGRTPVTAAMATPRARWAAVAVAATTAGATAPTAAQAPAPEEGAPARVAKAATVVPA